MKLNALVVAATLASALLVSSVAAEPRRRISLGRAALRRPFVMNAAISASTEINDVDANANADADYEYDLYSPEKLRLMDAMAPFAPEKLADQCPPPLPKFQCQPPGALYPRATNVNQLRPTDISAIMALGDSITAGFVMNGGNLPTINIQEYRGKVYSTGGDKGATTLANFLKVYNPTLLGSSTGTTLPSSKGKELNAAVTGAQVQELPSQISRLASELSKAKNRSARDGWKLLVLLIGANNLCGACTGASTTTPDYFEGKFRDAMGQIRRDLPNTFVAVVATFNISQVWDAAQTSTYCKSTFSTLGICGCAGKNAQDRLKMDVTGLEYNRRMEKVAAEFRGLNDPTFTVSVQPGLVKQDFAKFGQCFLSNFDCFHPAENANQAFAITLWNNLFTPRGEKPDYYDPENVQINCPGPNSFFQ